MIQNSPYIIAEPGSTHEGDFRAMLDCIRIATDTDCNAIKFQWLSSPNRLAERRNAPEYEHAYQKIAFPASWHAAIADYCRKLGIDYACTVYLPEDATIVAPYVAWLKVASFEAEAEDLLRACDATRAPLIISTGMFDDDALDQFFALLERHKIDMHVDTVLHCVSAYPTPTDQAGLRGIAAIKRRLQREVIDARVGYSDHTKDRMAGALAVAAGAEVLEVHMAAPRTPVGNPDWVVSHEDWELGHYVRQARKAALMLGPIGKHVQPAEAPMLRYRAQPERK